jgi:hypothetical protein
MIELVEKDNGLYLHFTFDETWNRPARSLVTSELLGNARIPDLPYVQPDGSPYRIDTDYFGDKRDKDNPNVGPFENLNVGLNELKVWPRNW